MKNWKKILGAALVAIASVALFIACGESGDDCLIDSDCAQGEVCEGTVCVPTCTDDTECATGEKCLARENGTGTVCKADDGGTNNGGSNNGTNNGGNNGTTCSDAADPTQFCVDETGNEDAVCNSDTDACEVPMAAEPFVIQILDETTDADACASTEDIDDDGTDDASDAGSDIGWAELRRDQDVFYAKLEDHIVGMTDANLAMGYQSFPDSLANGTDPGVTAGSCPEFAPGNVLALGCGGYITVKFVDDGGNPVPIKNGDTLFVFEWGATCSNAASPDQWRAYLCNPGVDPIDQTSVESECIQPLGMDVSSGADTVNVEVMQ